MVKWGAGGVGGKSSIKNSRLQKKHEEKQNKVHPVKAVFQLNKSFFELGELLFFTLEDSIRNSLKEYTKTFIAEYAIRKL